MGNEDEEDRAASTAPNASDGAWDGSPRAVVPDNELLASELPLLGLGAHAKQSPLPYGLAVLVDKRPVPLYYVSPKVATSRGRGVRTGWYVAAELGRPFQLRMTNAWTKNASITPRGLVRVAEICVDGANIFGNPHENVRLNFQEEEDFAGFTVGVVYEDGSTQGRERVKPFRFAKAKTNTEAKHDADAEADVGMIQLRIYKGHARDADLSETEKTYDVAAPSVVHEKRAVKGGQSVCVDLADEVVNQAVSRSNDVITYDEAPPDTVDLFLREKYWLESRCIIDAEGNAWKPSTGEAPIDLTLTEDADLGATSVTRNAKRAKVEVVDLTLVRDNIDLTQDDNAPA